MTDRLIATVEQRRSGARLIKLTGVLDEHNRLGDLMEKVGAGTALINLAGVERINSTGARDWVRWLASIEARGIKPVLIACSPAVVDQLNRTKNFAGNAVVKSFQIPYHCDTCDLDKLMLVYVADMSQPPAEAPVCTCDGCGGPMMFVEDIATYFAFLNHLPRPKPRTKRDDEPTDHFARGSRASITGEHVKQVSQPRLSQRESRSSLSAFQMIEARRPSEQDILHPRVMPGDDRPYLIAIVALLLCAVGVLVALLFL